MTDRATLEALIWEQVSQHLFVPKNQFMAELAAYTLEPVSRDGLLLAVVMRREDELHFVTFKAGPLSREMVRAAFAPQLEKYGYLTTRTPKVDTRQHRFNRLVGFQAVGEDEFDIHYQLRREDCRV